ncbi:MAG TPA: zinc-dependent alcohol dehydrogenase family protein [Candidatus Binataceae bacterium]|nr:zinc-dependent alcohol dehydrogenase family protein [Candidatus Binataceae bacterium]
MRAAVLEALQQPLVVKEVPDPACPPNGAVVRTEAEGVCRSDWHIWMGDWFWVGLAPQPPFVMGHEFCGVIEEVGKEVRNFRRGDRVVVPFSQCDGACACEFCRTGHSNICNTPQIPGITYPGGYGRLVGVPGADLNLVNLSEKIDFVDAASMGCRFMTSFHGLVDQAQLKPGEWVAVHGCGGIGLSAINIAAAVGANVIAVDLDDRKLELAKKMGANHVVNAKKNDPIGAIFELSGGGAHVAVDALGAAITCRNSMMSLRKRGRQLQIGLTTQAEKGEVSMPIDRMVLMELQLIGTIGMQSARYPAMLQMVESGYLTPGAMVTERIALEQVSRVIEGMTEFQNVGTAVITKF